MLKEIDLTGIYVAPIVLYLMLATPAFLFCRWMLARLGVLSFALFGVILSAVVALR